MHVLPNHTSLVSSDKQPWRHVINNTYTSLHLCNIPLGDYLVDLVIRHDYSDELLLNNSSQRDLDDHGRQWAHPNTTGFVPNSYCPVLSILFLLYLLLTEFVSFCFSIVIRCHLDVFVWCYRSCPSEDINILFPSLCCVGYIVRNLGFCVGHTDSISLCKLIGHFLKCYPPHKVQTNNSSLSTCHVELPVILGF